MAKIMLFISFPYILPFLENNLLDHWYFPTINILVHLSTTKYICNEGLDYS